jgi:hypothetical protein
VLLRVLGGWCCCCRTLFAHPYKAGTHSSQKPTALSNETTTKTKTKTKHNNNSCAAPQTFMSNMLQAVSILYKTRLPLLLAFNKVDAARHDFAIEWMDDFDAYSAALDADSSYAATLSRCVCFCLNLAFVDQQALGHNNNQPRPILHTTQNQQQ